MLSECDPRSSRRNRVAASVCDDDGLEQSGASEEEEIESCVLAVTSRQETASVDKAIKSCDLEA